MNRMQTFLNNWITVIVLLILVSVLLPFYFVSPASVPSFCVSIQVLWALGFLALYLSGTYRVAIHIAQEHREHWV